MSHLIAVKRARLTERHLFPGRCKHTRGGSAGTYEFGRFVELVLVRDSEDDSEYILYYRDENDQSNHSHYDSILNALDAAEWDLEVKRGDWKDVNEPF